MTRLELCRSCLEYGRTNNESPMTTLAVCLASLAGFPPTNPNEMQILIVQIAMGEWINGWGMPLLQTIEKWLDQLEKDSRELQNECPTNS